MKTRTAPWDYERGEQHKLYGADLDAVRESWDRLNRAKAALIQIIGKRGYMYFEMDQPVYVKTSNRLMTEAIERELDLYECYCTPNHDCAGCEKRNQAKIAQEN